MLVEEFSGSSAGHGLGVVTAMALVAATVRVQSLALEVLEALGVAKKINKNKIIDLSSFCACLMLPGD